MSHGKLETPNLDDRNWQQLKDEAIRLIPKHTKEWTDHNPSDLGITLIELFAWIAEQIIYRLNRVPEKNYVEFLNLIGVTRYPPTPAKTDITFKINGDAVVTVPKWTQVSTPPSGTQDGIIFETDAELNAVNLKKCLLLDAPTNTYQNYTAKIITEPYQPVELAIPVAGKKTLLLGLAGPTILTLSLIFKIEEVSASTQPSWRYSTSGSPQDWPKIIPVINSSYAFKESGRIGIQIPDGWHPLTPGQWGATPATPDDEATDLLYWLGIQFEDKTNFKLKRLAANMVSASNVVTVADEPPFTSNGQPFQVFRLRQTPLYRDENAPDPFAHLVIAAKDPNGNWENWKRVEDFNQGDGAEYLCNPVTGEISFGNYPTGKSDNPGNGRIPPEGRQIKAISYRYVAGESNGNVPAKTIIIQRQPVSNVAGVTNEEAATEGSDWEKIEDTKRRGPKSLKMRDRAVTAEDFEELARAATTDIKKARCFPPKRKTENEWIMEPFPRTPGQVHLVLVPDDKLSRQPTPTPEMIEEVKAYLDRRRTITSILIKPLPPFYVEIKVTATVYVKPGQNHTEVKRNIKAKLYDFLHPITGGSERKGWEIGQDLYVPEVFAVIDAIPEVSYVADLQVIGVFNNEAVLATGVRLEIKDYQLICASELNDDHYKIIINEEELEL